MFLEGQEGEGMLRFIMTLLGKDYEPCKSCQVLKQQLEVANNEKKEILDLTVSLFKPQPMPVNYDGPKGVIKGYKRLSTRIREKEREDFERAQAIERNKKEDEEAAKVASLEDELGVSNAIHE